jgi:hypothetical protein
VENLNVSVCQGLRSWSAHTRATVLWLMPSSAASSRLDQWVTPSASYKAALVAEGIPATSFAVEDVQAEFQRLRDLGVRFTQEPLDMGGVTTAVFDDTCGNLIQIAKA